MGRDNVTGADIGIDFEHYKVHDSQMYQAGYGFTVTAASTGDFLIITGSVDVHLKGAVNVDGKAVIKFYEGVTAGAGNTGTSVPIFNMHRDSSNSGGSLCFRGTAWSTNTEVLLQTEFLGGGTNPVSRFGGSARQETEWVLLPNTNYILQIDNKEGSTITTSVNLQFYELEV